MDRNELILDALKIDADPFALCELRGECSLGLGRAPATRLHYVLAGHGHLSYRGLPPQEMEPGCLVLVPACQWHALHSHGTPGTDIPGCYPAGLNLQHHIAGEGATGGMSVLCSDIHVSLRGTHGLIDLLRQPMFLDISRCGNVETAMRRILDELAAPRMGSHAMIRALLLQCLISLFREHMLRDDPAIRWLVAVTEPRLWAALQLMLGDDGQAVSVERLAAEAGLSRSQFALHFSDVFGQGPMSFMRELRLARAAQFLADSSDPIKRIADRSGFKSRSAFSRAFSVSFGMSPQQFRSNARNGG